MEEKRYKKIIFFIIILGMFIRTIGIQDIPNALNVDEVSAGYEAFSIVNYGIDRNGNFMPCFLKAWGSGQNALLTYLMMPFVKVLGLNILAIRLPMAIVGGISLIVFYLLLRRISNKKIAMIGLLFFAICPWHIMKSRWGLESNLFPDIILIFIYLLVEGLTTKKKYLYYISFIVAGLSTYSYGTSYFFLPLLIIPLLIILTRKKEITIKDAIISLVIVAFVSLPMILFVIINTFNLEQINFPFLTIPKLEVNRYQEITSIFSSDFIKSSYHNFIQGIKIVITQNDNLPWNSISWFGTIYTFSIIFTIIGIIKSFRKNDIMKIKYNYIFNICFIVSIILLFICEPNINRLNIIMIPIIYYTVIGIYEVINQKREVELGISIIYAISFLVFMCTYVNLDYNEYVTFEGGLKDVVEYVDCIDKEVYITNKIKEPYIYVLFYSQYNTNNFVKEVEYYDKNVEFMQVKSFGKYHFSDIKNLDEENIYVINKDDVEQYNINGFNEIQFEKYIVLEKYR